MIVLRYFKKKNIPIFLILISLILIYIYVLVIDSIPSKITIFQGEEISIPKLFGLSLSGVKNEKEMEYNLEGEKNIKNKNDLKEEKAVEVLSNQNKPLNQVGTTKLKLNLLDNIFIKDVSVDVLPRTKVIPIRKCGRCEVVYKWSFSGWNV